MLDQQVYHRAVAHVRVDGRRRQARVAARQHKAVERRLVAALDAPALDALLHLRVLGSGAAGGLLEGHRRPVAVLRGELLDAEDHDRYVAVPHVAGILEQVGEARRLLLGLIRAHEALQRLQHVVAAAAAHVLALVDGRVEDLEVDEGGLADVVEAEEDGGLAAAVLEPPLQLGNLLPGELEVVLHVVVRGPLLGLVDLSREVGERAAHILLQVGKVGVRHALREIDDHVARVVGRHHREEAAAHLREPDRRHLRRIMVAVVHLEDVGLARLAGPHPHRALELVGGELQERLGQGRLDDPHLLKALLVQGVHVALKDGRREEQGAVQAPELGAAVSGAGVGQRQYFQAVRLQDGGSPRKCRLQVGGSLIDAECVILDLLHKIRVGNVRRAHLLVVLAAVHLVVRVAGELEPLLGPGLLGCRRAGDLLARERVPQDDALLAPKEVGGLASIAILDSEELLSK
mmetsp:Transcript_21621/g.36957  ORF Transcript_21621/g.36957 Transcript_21621/m.36957 type:complete len:461 (+) Transcript_21621:3467-4849(+)